MAPSSDIFVAELTDLGTGSQFRWLHQGGGIGSDDAYTLAVRGRDVWRGRVGYIARLAEQTLSTSPARTNTLAVFPKPARGEVRVRVLAGAEAVVALDLAGRSVRTVAVRLGQPETVVSLRGLASGSYLLRCGTAVGKLQVE